MFIFNYLSALTTEFELAWKRVRPWKRHLEDNKNGYTELSTKRSCLNYDHT